MKKKIIWLIIAAVLLAAMILALIALNREPEQEEAAPPSAAETIYVTGSGSAPSSTRVEITNETGTYEVVNRTPEDGGSDLVITGFEKLSLDTYGLGAIASNASSLAARRVVSEAPDSAELAAYGLDKPRATVKAAYSDGSSATLLFGADAPGGEGVYAQRRGHDTVYLVSSTLAGYFLNSRLDYVSTTVTATDSESQGYDKIVLSGSNYPEPIVIVRTPETEVSAAGITINTHSIISPIEIGLNSNTGMESLYASYGLMASRVVDVGGDADTPAKYGLDEPAAIMDATGVSDELSFVLRISATDSDGNVYLIKDGSPVIYQLPASTLTWLSLSLFDLMDKMVIVPNIKNVSRVTLTTPDKIYVFDLTGEDDGLVVNLDGVKLPDAKKEDGTDVDSVKNFRQLYQTMIGASYTGETDLTPAEDEKPLVQIEYTYKSELGRDPDVLSFYSGPARKTLMVFNGGKPYLGSSVYLDRLTEDAAKVAAGQSVKAYY